MEFCEKCGGMLIVKNEKAVCARCGHRSQKKLKIKASEKIGKAETIAVIEEGENIYPIIEMRCPVCKNKNCYFWTRQTRAADESETKFYKCTKCGHTWRVYR